MTHTPGTLAGNIIAWVVLACFIGFCVFVVLYNLFSDWKKKKDEKDNKSEK